MEKRGREWDDDGEYQSGRYDSWRRADSSESSWYGKGKGKGLGKGKGGDDRGKGKGKGKGGKGFSRAPTFRATEIGSQRLSEMTLPENTEHCALFDMDGSVKKQMLQITSPPSVVLPGNLAVVPFGEVQPARAEVLLNYFPVQIQPGQQAFVYSVEFRPPLVVPATTDNTKLRTYLLMKGLEQQPGFDASTVVYAGGPQLFAPQPLPVDEIPYQLRDGKEGVIYLEMAADGIMDWDTITPQHQFVVASVFQAGLRKLPNRCRIGRITYDLSKRDDIDLFQWEDRTFGRLRLLAGPTARLVATDRGPMLVIDLSARVKHEESVKQLLERRVPEGDFVGRYGIVAYNRKAFIIQNITWDVKPTDTFPWRKGGQERQISYADYVVEKYGRHMPPHWRPDLRQPMVVEFDKRRQQTNYYLAECVFACGLSQGMKKDTDFMKDLRDRVGGNPSWRAWLMQHLVLPSNDPQCAPFWDLLGTWGLTITPKFTVLEADELPPPTIQFGDKAVRQTDVDGKWAVFDVARRENRQMMMAPPATSGLTLHADWEGQQYFVEMGKKAAAMGMTLKLTPWEMPSHDYCGAIQKENRPLDLLCLQMERKDETPGNPYGQVKQSLTLRDGIITQCALCPPNNKAMGVKAQMAAVQVCAKLGGVPWAVVLHQTALPMKGTMVMGFDLAHTKKRGDERSLMAMVAALDAECLRCWHMVQEMQLGATILDPAAVHASITGALKAYKDLHGEYPKRVVVVRNGVGESQYHTLGRQEVTVLQGELAKVCPQVQLLVMLTIKDTRARVFKVSQGELVNPVPGTVVSGGSIRNSAGFEEFLIIPHGTTQGTVQPLKIVILHNSIPGLPLVDVQRAVVQLCSSYFNFFGAIKMPSVIQYASKLLKFLLDHRDPTGGLYLPLPPRLERKMFYL